MSDPERKPAPDVIVAGLRTDHRQALLDQHEKLDPGSIFCFQDREVDGQDLRLKGMEKVRKSKDGPDVMFRGDIVCKQPREVCEAIRGAASEHSLKLADQRLGEQDDPEMLRQFAKAKKPRPLKRKRYVGGANDN